jgi:hypothetical protein
MKDLQHYLEARKELAEAELKIINRYLQGTEPSKRTGTSNIEIVKQVLKSAGRPLHIAEIIASARKEFGIDLERDSVVSNLVKKIRAGQTFIRTAPNTFSLME